MAKYVRYNGGTRKATTCDSPNCLNKEELYTVILERDKGYQTNYILAGVDGEFNSVWFDIVEETPETAEIGVSGEIPMVAKEFHYSRFVFIAGNLYSPQRVIEKVEKANYLGNNIYVVEGGEVYLIVLVA